MLFQMIYLCSFHHIFFREKADLYINSIQYIRQYIINKIIYIFHKCNIRQCLIANIYYVNNIKILFINMYIYIIFILYNYCLQLENNRHILKISSIEFGSPALKHIYDSMISRNIELFSHLKHDDPEPPSESPCYYIYLLLKYN